MITRKSEFYRLWRAGELGNKPRIWSDVQSLQLSDYRGELTIRSVAGANGHTKYRVPFDEAVRLGFTWPCACNFNESMPDDDLLVQGEVARLPYGLVLSYDTVPGRKYNEARQHFVTCFGLEAKLLLQHHLWASSYDDLMELLTLYEDHVIEFSTYQRAVGDQPHRNTIIWEVRSY